MNATRRLRAIANAIGFALGTLLLLLALPMLAARIAATHLLDDAQQELATLQSGQPLWKWSLRKPRDLVAGRAFGHAQVIRADDSLQITSGDGTPFELGLPIAWAVDLAHWPILQLQLQSSAAGSLGLIWQGGADTPPCLATSASALSTTTRELRLDLRQLDWRTPQGTPCLTPGNAWMLRLRVQLPTAATLQWRTAALLADQILPPPTDTALPTDMAASNPASSATPVFRLPSNMSAETMLNLRDELRLKRPAALVVPANATLQAPVREIRPEWIGWAMCLSYLLALLGLSLRRSQKPGRLWLDIVVCMAGPLWLIAGLQWGTQPSWSGVAAFVGAVLYAASIEWRQKPRSWHWVGKGWQDWAWPLALLPITALLLAFCSQSFKPPIPSHVLAYLAWAALQQWLMLAVVMCRLQRLVKQPAWIILMTAALFALLHTPNGRLMQLCLLAELWWAWCFLRSRSLLPIALAHAACALLVEAGLVGSVLRSLEVSARFIS